MDSIDYSYKLKEELNKLVPRPKNSSKLYLSTRIQKKVNKMNNPIGIKEEIISFILKISLYFIKDDGFITEKYFSLIENKIYKLFLDLILSPNEKEFTKLINGFKNLDNGAGNIFLICENICKGFGVGEFDLFFIIILNEFRESLDKLLKLKYNFNLVESHENIVQKLGSYTKIKNNDKIDSKEVLNFFMDVVAKTGDMKEKGEKKED